MPASWVIWYCSGVNFLATSSRKQEEPQDMTWLQCLIFTKAKVLLNNCDLGPKESYIVGDKLHGISTGGFLDSRYFFPSYTSWARMNGALSLTQWGSCDRQAFHRQASITHPKSDLTILCWCTKVTIDFIFKSRRNVCGLRSSFSASISHFPGKPSASPEVEACWSILMSSKSCNDCIQNLVMERILSFNDCVQYKPVERSNYSSNDN